MYTVNVILCVHAFVLAVVNSTNIANDTDSKGCILPKYPENGRWSIRSGPNHAPGEKVEKGVDISIACHSQYELNGSPILKCNNGKWSAEIGECLELCPPIIEKHSTIVNCTTDGKTSDCRKPTNGTVAVFQCSPFYENQEINRNPFRICRSGKWSEEIVSCHTVCGLEPASSNNGTIKHFYPWNVLIYLKKLNDTYLHCGGTLINEKTILTSAACLFSDAEFYKTLFSPKDLVVAVGKTVEEFKDPDSEAQFSIAQELIVPGTYKGPLKNYFSDFGIVIARKPFKMSSRVQPACVDWNNKQRKEFNSMKSSGRVAAIVKPLEHSTKNFDINVSILDDADCYRLLSLIVGKDAHNDSNVNYNNNYTTIDKYCTSNITTEKDATCSSRINKGAGLIIKSPLDEKYYVYGVASFGTILDDDCQNKTFTLFTKVYYFIHFISAKTKLHSTIERVQYQTTCGIKSVQVQTLIVNGNTVAKGDYPWQVAIYKVSGSSKQLICGGSLINQRVILTAAHCVTNKEGEKEAKNKYIVAVGKYYRSFDDPRDNNNTQFSGLEEIILPTEYKGRSQNYLGDIAILISETSFDISREIQPICVDWEAKYEEQFLQPNVTGYVTGWGYTQENKNPSEELKDLEIPYIDPKQCKNELPSDFEAFLTIDKLCAGFLNKGKSICKGDSGGGLVFKNGNDDRYYLAGVVSLSPQSSTGGCDSKQYTLFTRVSRYTINFIRKTVSLYWG